MGHQLMEKILSLSYFRKADRMSINMFKSKTLALYQMLRPKMIDRWKFTHDELLKDTMDYMDMIILRPSEFKLSTAIIIFGNLNQFCEDYKLTSTSMWTGRSSESKKGDVYSV